MGKPLSNDIKLRAENFPNPSKVDVSEYKMMDSRWLRGGRVFSASNVICGITCYHTPNFNLHSRSANLS
ncbi:uncharacterized protein OCT59_003888 [Rhizophagus irregularis]|uniref:uncharacterized protein n=1 Tax=Rhizophagus irregularis TaxID=588596 RepID=UPI003328BE33|nr:hypothetical protein OCT59_003888 [Rhizophagus irregularis]